MSRTRQLVWSASVTLITTPPSPKISYALDLIIRVYTPLHGGRRLANARARLSLPQPVVRLPGGRGGAAGRGKDRVRRTGERRVRRHSTGHGWGRRGARAPVAAASGGLDAGAAERRGRCRREARAGCP